jgi:hypothetical protein
MQRLRHPMSTQPSLARHPVPAQRPPNALLTVLLFYALPGDAKAELTNQCMYLNMYLNMYFYFKT